MILRIVLSDRKLKEKEMFIFFSKIKKWSSLIVTGGDAGMKSHLRHSDYSSCIEKAKR